MLKNEHNVFKWKRIETAKSRVAERIENTFNVVDGNVVCSIFSLSILLLHAICRSLSLSLHLVLTLSPSLRTDSSTKSAVSFGRSRSAFFFSFFHLGDIKLKLLRTFNEIARALNSIFLIVHSYPKYFKYVENGSH